MTGWLGVVSAEHVRRGVGLGIAQIGHGKRGGLARMAAGDTLIYYSPRERINDGPPLKSFTAIGTVADDEIWQADEGAFRPFRRRVTYDLSAHPVEIDALKSQLDLTSTPNWGYALRRGLVQLSEDDVARIRLAMTSEP
jgi:hypothetical protein